MRGLGRILDEIEKSDRDKRLKEFMREVLKLEADHSEEERWNYSDEYEKLIKKAMR